MTEPILKGLFCVALATEVVALATGDVTITALTRRTLDTAPKRLAAAYLAWHLLAEADVRARILARRGVPA